MPHMKYFEAIGRIRDQYLDLINLFDRDDELGPMFLETRGLDSNDKALIQEELRVLDYLIGCQLGFAYDENIPKPKIEAVNRCFDRHLDHLKQVFDIHAYNVNKHQLKNVRKQYKACRYYIFKFSLDGWCRSMPDEILTLQNKYPNSNLFN